MATDLGRRVYGLAAIWLGLVGLGWGDFAAVWQPVPDGTPGRTALAYAAAVLLLAGGGAIQWRRTAKWAALGLAAISLVFALLWSRRIFTHAEIFGVWSGTAEQLAIALGGVAVWAGLEPGGARRERIALACRLAFGLCLVIFGGAHFLYVKETAALVPKWLPPSREFWAYATGACHVAAGLALLSGLQALLAARLATAMFVGFGLLVWIPQAAAAPGQHMAWAGNGINLALIGAVWAVADMIARLRAPASSEPLHDMV
jgi:uncharacterized membrane protein